MRRQKNMTLELLPVPKAVKMATQNYVEANNSIDDLVQAYIIPGVKGRILNNVFMVQFMEWRRVEYPANDSPISK